MSQANGPYGSPGAYEPGGTPPPGIPPQGGWPGGRQPAPERGPSLDAGRYWAGAIATVVVAALIGLAAVFVLENVFGLAVDSPPVAGTTSNATAWAVAGGAFALLAAVLLQLLVMSTPRPRSFFGWVIGLATVVLAALPFAGAVDPVPDLLAAIIWVIVGTAVWSLLTTTLAYTTRSG